ncbi:MAG: hypothetical protein WBX16_01965 [Candidatus Acidiferrales bacterium]
MGYGAQDSRLQMTKAEEDQYLALPWDAGIAYLHELEVAKGLRVPDPMNPSVLHEVEPGTQPRRFAKVLTVNGQKKTFEGESELEVERQANQYLSQVFTEANQPTDEPGRDANGRFAKTASDDAAAQQRFVDSADLQLQFQRGELTVQEYIERSGVLAEEVEKVLDKTGVSEIVQERQGKKIVQQWSSAVETFIQSHPDWIGGDRNRDILGTLIKDNGWDDAENKVAALEAAYEYAVANKMLVPNPEVDAYNRIASANSRAEIDSALGRDTRLNHQQIWGSR